MLALETVGNAVKLAVFRVQRRRSIMERTFGWLNRDRRLRKDYEGVTAGSEAPIQIAMIHRMAQRLAAR
jgi:transposase